MIALEFVLDSMTSRHFLTKTRALRVRHSFGGVTNELPVTVAPDRYRVAVDETRGGRLDLEFTVRYRLDGREHELFLLRQSFDVAPAPASALTPKSWMRGASALTLGMTVAQPALHPALAVTRAQGAAISVRLSLPFLDITDMFLGVHGRMPWFRTLEALKSTPFTLRVLASLRGHPFIWYAVVPPSALAADEIIPHVFYWPADYGGIDYAASTERGILSKNHHRSIRNIQSGAETLCYFLLTPLDDARFLALAPSFEKARADFESMKTHEDEQLPRPTYVFRRVLEYMPDGDGRGITGGIWYTPFGLEQAIAGTKQVLFFPQVAGGDATHAIRQGLRGDLRAALAVMADRMPSFRSATPTADRLVLSCFSQSGGNLFTACRNNREDLRGIIAVEPQFMNARLGDEPENLALGREVIPGLLTRGVRVAIVSRRREAWQRAKFLPRGVDTSKLTLLPVDQSLLAYPQLPDRGQFRHRLSRLLAPRADAAMTFYADPANAPADAKSRKRIAAVDRLIAFMRAGGLDDEQLTRWAFPPRLDLDRSGGFHTHFFVLCGAEDDSAFLPDGRMKPGTRPVTIYERAVRTVLGP